MDNLEQNIRQLVQEVVKNMNLNPEKESNIKSTGVFSNLNNAVIAADLAFKEFNKLSLETRKKIIESMRNTSLANKKVLAKMAHEETGMGRWEDKVVKNELGIFKTPGVEDITRRIGSASRICPASILWPRTNWDTRALTAGSAASPTREPSSGTRMRSNMLSLL